MLLSLIIHSINFSSRLPTAFTPSNPTSSSFPIKQFIISIIALAAAATALHVASQAADATDFANYESGRALISLPSGCTKSDLASK